MPSGYAPTVGEVLSRAAGASDVAHSYQAFLGDGDYQFAILPVDVAPTEAAPAALDGLSCT